MHVARIVLSTNLGVWQDKEMVSALLELKASLDTIWADAFGRNEAFANALKEAFELFINQRQNKCDPSIPLSRVEIPCPFRFAPLAYSYSPTSACLVGKAEGGYPCAGLTHALISSRHCGVCGALRTPALTDLLGSDAALLDVITSCMKRHAQKCRTEGLPSNAVCSGPVHKANQRVLTHLCGRSSRRELSACIWCGHAGRRR